MLIRIKLGGKLFILPMRWVERLTRHIMAAFSGMRRITDWALGASQRGPALTTPRPPRFEHGAPLDQHHVRLIRLPDEGSASNLTTFTIETFVLDQLPAYIALSYTWGPPQSPETPLSSSENHIITIDNRTFTALPNLYDALRHVVLARPGEYLWVDSICINQEDLEERAAQVGIMDTIFGGAKETIIWLGRENEHTGSALHTIRQMAYSAEDKIVGYARARALGDVFVVEDADLLAKNGLPPMTSEDWQHLSDLFSRTWFSRVWMIQEVALAKSPTCLIGHQTIAWDSIGYAALLLGASNALVGLYAVGRDIQHAALVVGITQAMNLQTMREWCRGDSSPLKEAFAVADFSAGITPSIPETGLQKLLVASNGFNASIRRDRVYAVLGLLNHLSRSAGHPSLNLSINYLSTDDEILASLAVRLFNQTESLQLLSLAGEASRGDASSLPSWMPSFEDVNAPILGPSTHNWKPFGLPGETDDDPVFYIDDSCQYLHVQAMSPNLGSIEEIGETWEEMNNGHFMTCIRLLLHCGPLYTFTSQPIVEAFWRTLIMDNDMSQRPAPRRLSKSFADWIFLTTLTALVAGRETNPDLFDLFDTLEPLFILANTRDSTDTLPKSAAMVEQAARFGIFSDPSNPMLPHPARERILRNKAKVAAPYEGLLRIALPPGRRLARTVRGYLCLVPLKAEVGDRVMIVRGCPTPLVLRRIKSEVDSFRLIGDVYVHGAMFGEHVTKDSVWRNIVLG